MASLKTRPVTNPVPVHGLPDTIPPEGRAWEGETGNGLNEFFHPPREPLFKTGRSAQESQDFQARLAENAKQKNWQRGALLLRAKKGLGLSFSFVFWTKERFLPASHGPHTAFRLPAGMTPRSLCPWSTNSGWTPRGASLWGWWEERHPNGCQETATSPAIVPPPSPSLPASPPSPPPRLASIEFSKGRGALCSFSLKSPEFNKT